MKLIKPTFEIMDDITGDAGINILKKIERCARVSYKSENMITDSMMSAYKLIKNCITRGHESVLEHASITVKITCDRGVSHEIVRHRLASYTQESTRYCNYSKNKFGNELTYIVPSFILDPVAHFVENREIVKPNIQKVSDWYKTCEYIEKTYMDLSQVAIAQYSRSILPNSLKTEIVVTMNIREWRHFFKLRCAPEAHPDISSIASMILEVFHVNIPVLFDDLAINPRTATSLEKLSDVSNEEIAYLIKTHFIGDEANERRNDKDKD